MLVDLGVRHTLKGKTGTNKCASDALEELKKYLSLP